ncbi:hypothetical protein R1sor_016931 [Riccia sorocarpa]|uniref:CCHC-type domain-containing protein n=1 Tax=Riccia sorocarpa TaxID=122646 RepID=A0ABD3HJ57_9MARC
MVYCTPWEPGYDTKKIVAKKMACWVDLLGVDPMMDRLGRDMMESLGPVIQMAGVTQSEDGKFANVRGCVLLDMTKPLPTILRLRMNQVSKKVKIKYDQLPDACFSCQERGHIARYCTKATVTSWNLVVNLLTD